MATAKPTTDHDQIRKWVEARGGHPARVKATGRGNDPGILRIDFPGFSGEDTLEAIEWDEFFEWFDRDKLALLLSSERGNRFNKLVARTSAKRGASSKKSSGKKSTSRRAVKSTSKKSAASGKSAAKKSAKKSAAKKSSRRVVKSTSKKKSASRASKKRGTSKKSAARR